MSGFSEAELAAIPDDELVEAIIGVVSNSSLGREESEVARILEESPDGFGIVHSVFLLDAEVRNGGFHQYFWNHGTVYLDLTRRALARLGAEPHLAVLEESATLLESHPVEPTRGNPEEVLEAFSESAIGSAFDQLDSRWYDLPEVEPLLVAFVRRNPAEVWEED